MVIADSAEAMHLMARAVRFCNFAEIILMPPAARPMTGPGFAGIRAKYLD
jgi:hypothetical protein